MLPEIMQIARKRSLVKRKRDNRRPGSSLKLELHSWGLDYTKYPPEKLEKLYEYLFGEATAFCNHIEAKRKF